MPSILIHCCCAHCAAYTVTYWRGQGYDTAGFWYNPNIHPAAEHASRRESMKRLGEELKLPLTISPGYEPQQYFDLVKGNEADRCRYCFTLRLSKTAAAARDMGFAGFTTTLLISPQQKHDLIVEVAGRVAVETGVAFLYADLRKRYSDSRHITKPMGLYRQQYCGCVYSRQERATEKP